MSRAPFFSRAALAVTLSLHTKLAAALGRKLAPGVEAGWCGLPGNVFSSLIFDRIFNT